MKQLAMVIDSSACIDCKACMIACKVENQVPEGYWRNWIKTSEPRYTDPDWMDSVHSSHFQPGGCMHCDNPPCVAACPTGATYKDRTDGSVGVNEKLCIGCGSCIPACPYGARYRHPVRHVVDKCDLCRRRREKGELPACVTTCPTKARVFGDIHDPKSDAARLLKQHRSVRIVPASMDTQPNMMYLSATAPTRWPSEPRQPDAVSFWKMVQPFVWGLVGLNAAGVLWMWGKQMLLPNDRPQTDHPSPDAEE